MYGESRTLNLRMLGLKSPKKNGFARDALGIA